MKRFLISSAALFAATLPIAAQAAPAKTASVQATCIEVIVEFPDGSTAPGLLCYDKGGQI